MKHHHRRRLADNHASAWIACSIVAVSATMMHPTGASLVAVGLVAALLVVLRWVAHMEGRHLQTLLDDEEEEEQPQ